MASGNARLTINTEVETRAFDTAVEALDRLAEEWRMNDAEDVLNRIESRVAVLHELVHVCGCEKGNDEGAVQEADDAVGEIEQCLEALGDYIRRES